MIRHSSLGEYKKKKTKEKMSDKKDGSDRPLVGHSHETRHNSNMKSLATTLSVVSGAAKLKKSLGSKSAASGERSESESGADMQIEGGLDDGNDDDDGPFGKEIEVEAAHGPHDGHDSVGGDGEHGSDDDEDEEDVDIEALKAAVEASPDTYENHVQYVRGLRISMETDDLRSARESMATRFPLVLPIWRLWLKDEAMIRDPHSNAADFEYVFGLYERAVKDYLSVDLWMDFISFALKHHSESTFGDFDEKNVRRLFEKAVAAAGTHCARGGEVWAAYRRFEKVLYSAMAALQESGAPISDNDLTQQLARIRKLFVRELSIPLVGMQSIFSEFSEWEKSVTGKALEETDEAFISKYEKVLVYLNKRMRWENQLPQLPPPATSGPSVGFPSSTNEVELWTEYLDYEEYTAGQKDPQRVVTVYERCIARCFLYDHFWSRYLVFIDTNLNQKSITTPLYTRAFRNCPWSFDVASRYLYLALRDEDTVAGSDDLLGVFEKTIAAGQNAAWTPQQRVELVLLLLDVVRQRMMTSEDGISDDETIAYATLFKTQVSAAAELLSQLPREAPEHFRVLGLWADVEVRLFKDIEEARNIWTKYDQVGDYKNVSAARLRISHERLMGDWQAASNLYKKVFSKLPTDWQMQAFGYEWVEFEQFCGTDKTLSHAQNRVSARAQDLMKKQAKLNPATSNPDSKNAKKRKAGTTTLEASSTTAATSSDVKSDATSSSTSSSSFSKPEKRKAVHSNTDASMNDSASKEDVNSPVKRVKLHEERSAIVRHGGEEDCDQKDDDSSNMDVEVDPKKEEYTQSEEQKRTAFVVNLPYGISDEDIQEKFSPYGTILQVRQAFSGSRPKGFGYVEFESAESVQSAIDALHGKTWVGRQLSVSVSNPPKVNRGREATGTETFTVFVRNFPKLEMEVLRQKLLSHFADCGVVEEVRLAHDRQGELKNFAYVQFQQEASVEKALRLHKQKFEGKTLTVERCYAPGERPKPQPKQSTVSGKLSKRKKGRLFTPRTIQTTAVLKPKEGSTENGSKASDASSSPSAPKSNADFRAMLFSSVKKKKESGSSE